jgi:hypothetical protein
MAIGRITGSVLKSNLTRNGVDLAFETNLLYLDVTNSRVGIGTSEPTATLHVNGNTNITGNLTGVTDVTAGGTTQTDIIKNREQRYTTSNMMKFNQLYTGASSGSYFSANEYQKVVTITPSGNSQNYQVIGRITAQNAGETHVVNFNAALRSNTLPDLNWTILYDEEYNGGRYIDPQLWTKETTTAQFIFAFKTLATIYGTVTVDFDVIPRNSSQLDNVSINTTQDSEQTSVDTGFTANDMTRVVRKQSSNINVSGSVTATSFTGDGSNLSNVPATFGDLTANGSTIQSPSNADITLDPSGTGVITAKANLVPDADNTYSLGTSSKKWSALHVAGGTIHLGNLQLKDSGNNQLSVFQSDGTTQASITVANIGDLSIVGSTISAPSNADITITNSGTGNVDVDSNKIVNLATPTADTDASTKKYVDDQISTVSTSSITQGDTSVSVTDSGTGSVAITVDNSTHTTFNSSGITLATGAFVGNLTGDVTGNADTATSATTATNITASANNATDETVYITFVDGATGGQGIETDTGLTYNPSTGVLTTTSVTGNLTGNVTGNVTGNADTATALATARNIAGQSFDGTGDITIASTDLSNTSAITLNTASQTLTNKTLTSPQINTQIDLLARGEIRFQDTTGGQYVGFKAPATVASNVMWTLPDADGTSGQVLSTDGAGTFSWADGGGGGSGSSYPNSTTSTMPGSNGNYDLAKNAAQTTAETPFETGGQDAFGVNLGTVFDMMDPTGTAETTDLGSDEAYVGA